METTTDKVELTYLEQELLKVPGSHQRTKFKLGESYYPYINFPYFYPPLKCYVGSVATIAHEDGEQKVVTRAIQAKTRSGPWEFMAG